MEDTNNCMFTKSILSKLENVKIKGDSETITNELQVINEKINYLANEVQKIYKYFKTEQDKKYKITSTNSLKTIESNNNEIGKDF